MGAECGRRRLLPTWQVQRKQEVDLLQPKPHMQRHVQCLNAQRLQRLLCEQHPQPAPLPPVQLHEQQRRRSLQEQFLLHLQSFPLPQQPPHQHPQPPLQQQQ